MRENNFDIVRLLLAATVVLVHASSLSQSPDLAFISTHLSGTPAVEGFFAISGFLIFASYERCRTLGEYFANRAWRILPAYWLATLFCVAIALCFGGRHFGMFLAANLSFATFLHPGVDGVFTHNPDNSAMNGALWTIKIEVMFYFAVPVIVWMCRRLKRDAVLVALLVLSVVYRQALAGSVKLSLQLPGQLSFFLVGALVYYHFQWFKRHGTLLMAGAVACLALHYATGWFFPRPIGVALLTMGACHLLPHVTGPTRWGDFSYGTYVLHYPIVQTLIAVGLYALHPWLALGSTVVLVAGVAAFSWFVVEKPSLAHSKSRRLRQAALGHAANYPAAVP